MRLFQTVLSTAIAMLETIDAARIQLGYPPR